MKQIHILSMMRSGHNAVANWLAEHFRAAGQTVAHFAAPTSITLYTQAMRATLADVIIFAWPDYPPELVEQWVTGEIITVLRDPANLFASRMELTRKLEVQLSTAKLKRSHDMELATWKAHAMMPGAIIYNRWFTDREYRADIVKAQRVKFTDVGFSRVPAAGGGSSFDGMNFDGRAQDMAVNDRWRMYESEPEWQRVLGQIDNMASIRERFGLPDVPDVPKTLSVAETERRERELIGFNPETERSGCCDPPLA